MTQKAMTNGEIGRNIAWNILDEFAGKDVYDKDSVLVKSMTKYISEALDAKDARIAELEAEVKELQDADVVSGVLRMENKKIGGTLAEICKLLRKSGVEKKYFDQADIHQPSDVVGVMKEMAEALEKIKDSAILGCGHHYIAGKALAKYREVVK